MSVYWNLKNINQRLLNTSYLSTATQIKHKTKRNQGKCLELSAGDGLFSLAMAQITELDIFLLENSTEMLKRAEINLKNSNLENRIHLLKGSLHQIPLSDGVMDLIISRSSVFFWRNQVKAFAEIYRVLAPGGIACIGGGFWNEEYQLKLHQIILQNHHQLENTQLWRQNPEKLKMKLATAGITTYEINYCDQGLWIVCRKPDLCKEVS